jgi:hypothetical protein
VSFLTLLSCGGVNLRDCPEASYAPPTVAPSVALSNVKTHGAVASCRYVSHADLCDPSDRWRP